jgi:hypothetical protein
MRQTSRHNTVPEQNRASTGMAGLDVMTGVASYKGALPLLGDADAAGRP